MKIVDFKNVFRCVNKPLICMKFDNVINLNANAYTNININMKI